MNSRREFLQMSGSAGLVSLCALPPAFLERATAAVDKRSDRVLVLIQLAGGNDGLNTVVPHGRDEYYKARPGIAIPRGQVLKINQELGLHPAMTGFMELYDEGQLAIVQGVGYPSPDRSHFRSMDIWHSARPEALDTRDGWLGRSLDAQFDRGARMALPALSIGTDKLPLALLSQRISVPTIRDPRQYELQLPGDSSRILKHIQTAAERPAAAQSDLAFVRSTTKAAVTSSLELKRVAANYQTAVPYPASRLANNLKTVAQMIASNFGPNIYFVSHDGFDTHSQQMNAHSTLLGELSSSVTAFVRDLAGHKLANEVLVVTFSEFGRRVAENGSLGSDHGAASQMFAISTKVKAGLRGAHPSMTDLDDGDLKFATDFRSVYSTLLDQWLNIDSEKVLGRRFAPIDLIKS